MNQEMVRLLGAPDQDRRDLFLTTARRVGTPEQNIEKDFWVCFTLDALFNGGLPHGGPRLLFKGGTSLSKAFGLIDRFSEDIDVTVFRDDLGLAATVEQLERLSGKKRLARLDAIRDTCSTYISGPMLSALRRTLSTVLEEAGLSHEWANVAMDDADRDKQTILVWYPSVTAPSRYAYIRPVIRIECGAKSALDPNRPMVLGPYINQDLPGFDLSVSNITTVDPTRTFWDKIIIAHGLRRWYERRETLRQEGQRVSRHYYDLHCMLHSDFGREAVRNQALGQDCGRHARLFFNRPDFDLASAVPGKLAVAPGDGMLEPLRRDYDAMAGMIFGMVPSFDAVMASMEEIQVLVNDVEIVQPPPRDESLQGTG